MLADSFSYGLLTPIMAYLMSCLGCFLGLRCATRARAFEGAARARWLLLAAVSIGVTGIWVMHFIAMLGFSMPGTSMGYDVPITILSMLIAVVVVSVGLLIVGFRANGVWPLLSGGLIIGCGVASMHYAGMSAMRMPGVAVHYNLLVVALSVVIAVAAGTPAPGGAPRLPGAGGPLAAPPVLGGAGGGQPHQGSGAPRATIGNGAATATAGGASAAAFLLPLILGISVLTFVLAAVILMAPTEDEIREDAVLMERIARLSGEAAGPPRS